ncbi:CapA family protein [Anabaena sp. CCY 9910]
MAKSVTLAFIGDVMLGRGVNEEMSRRSAESFWGDVLPILRGADAVMFI